MPLEPVLKHGCPLTARALLRYIRPEVLHRGSRLIPAVIAAALALVIGPASAGAASFEWIDGYDDAATPNQYDKVGILKEGPPAARKVLVLVPGTNASAAYFDPLAQDIVSRAKGWQVWAVERRENLFEDHSMADRVKRGEATPQQFFDYYLGYITKPSVTEHIVNVPDSSVLFARGWGMRVAVEDLRRVVAKAREQSREVVLGGHSLGGSITTAYATWDFGGHAGAEDLSGLVFIDGGSGPPTLTAGGAAQQLQNLQTTSPWFTFGGIAPPFAGLFNIVGSTLAKVDPSSRSILQGFPFVPPGLRAPVIVTNEAAYGFSLDTETSPPQLAAAHVHAGHLAATGDPRGWDPAGEITPIQRVAAMFSGAGLLGLDGTAWYHPTRLTIDSQAVGAGIANPAQDVLDVHSIHGRDLSLPVYAFATSLGNQRVLDAARLLASQSSIPERAVTLVDRSETYAHVDPLAAYPDNDFVTRLLPFLDDVHKVKDHGRNAGQALVGRP
jgi:pimeloyl-ACP methyl ester carboxylesterase